MILAVNVSRFLEFLDYCRMFPYELASIALICGVIGLKRVGLLVRNLLHRGSYVKSLALPFSIFKKL